MILHHKFSINAYIPAGLNLGSTMENSVKFVLQSVKVQTSLSIYSSHLRLEASPGVESIDEFFPPSRPTRRLALHLLFDIAPLGIILGCTLTAYLRDSILERALLHSSS